MGSSIAVRTRGDSPLRTPAGVRVCFSASDMFFASWLPSSRTKPAFKQDRSIAVRDGEEQGRDEARRRTSAPGHVEGREAGAGHRVPATRKPYCRVEVPRADQRNERARGAGRARASVLTEKVVR